MYKAIPVGLLFLFSLNTTFAQCPISSSSQDVNLYDGTKGVSSTFVEKHAGHAVGLNSGDRAFCSGTYLPGNLVLTAEHCIEGVGTDTSDLFVTFNYQLDSNGVLEAQSNFPVLEVVEKGLNSYDYAILRIGTNTEGVDPKNIYPVARLTNLLDIDHDFPAPTPYTSIGHSGGQPKSIDTGLYHTYKDRGWLEIFDLDTVGGASGGGILNEHGYVTSLALATGCGGSNIGKITGGHSIRELARFSPTIQSLFSTYKEEWINGHVNDFTSGIKWANIGPDQWEASGGHAEFSADNTDSAFKPSKTARLITHPFIIHPSGEKDAVVSYSTTAQVSDGQLRVYVHNNGARDLMWSSPSSYHSSNSGILTFDLSNYSGVVQLEFEAVAYAVSSGNDQGFYAVIDEVMIPSFSPSLARVAGKYNHIVSAWPNASGAGIHKQNGVLEAGDFSSGWYYAQWKLEVVAGNFVKISNRQLPSHSLHMQYGSLELGPAPDSWWSAHWVLEPAPGYSHVTMNAYRLKNRHTGKYLNIENMILQTSESPESNWSSYWNIKNVP